jgi:hypothetical protein
MNYHTVCWTKIKAHLKHKQHQNFLGDIYHKTRFHFVKIHNSCVCVCVNVHVCVCVCVCDYTWWGMCDVQIEKYYGISFVEQFSCYNNGITTTQLNCVLRLQT